MSPDPSPYMFWRGMILSLKSETEPERRYVEGILFALTRITETPGYANLTTGQAAELEQLHDRRTGAEGTV